MAPDLARRSRMLSLCCAAGCRPCDVHDVRAREAPGVTGVTAIRVDRSASRDARWRCSSTARGEAMSRIRTRILTRREYRKFEQAVRKAERWGGAGDLLAAYRRV